MPGRSFSAGNAYRYGFNGKENDKDISEGAQDYGMRVYDARLGKFLSLDPLQKKYPWYTPYQFAGNTPIQAIDIDGLEPCKATVDTHDRRTASQKFVDWVFNTSTGEKVGELTGGNSLDIVANGLQDPETRTSQFYWSYFGLASSFAGPELFSTKAAPFVKVEQAEVIAAKSEMKAASGGLKASGAEAKAVSGSGFRAPFKIGELPAGQQWNPVQQWQAKFGGSPTAEFQGAGGMFSGNQWLNKRIHANVKGIGNNVEIGFKLNSTSDGIDITIVNYKGKLNPTERATILEIGQKFMDKNLQTLKGWFQAAKQNGNVPTTAHGEIDKTIKVIDKKLQ